MGNIRSKILLGLLLGIAVIVGVALAADLNKVMGAVVAFEWGWLPLILGLTMFNYLLRFGKWHYYLRRMGIDNITWADSLKVFLGGFSMTATPGKLVDAVRQCHAVGRGPTCAGECRCAATLLLWYHLA